MMNGIPESPRHQDEMADELEVIIDGPASLRDRLTSRKFLSAVGLALAAIGGHLSGQISYQEMLTAIGAAVIAYMTAEGAADVAGRLRG